MSNPKMASDRSVELDDTSSAPESGQTPGGRKDPWDDDEPEAGAAQHAFPSQPGEAPNEEL
jgi:hypothetical protein